MNQSPINELLTYINSNVFEPALHADISVQTKTLIKKTRTKISKFRKIGDLYKYLNKVLVKEDQNKNKIYTALKKHDIKTFEDILPDIEAQFYPYLNDVTTLSDLTIGMSYTKQDTMALANNFNSQAGTRLIIHKDTPLAMICEIKLTKENYDNEWIEKGKLLKFFPKTFKGNKTSKEELVSQNNPEIPIYVFIKSAANDYIFNGRFNNIQRNIENGKLWILLERCSIHDQSIEEDTYRNEFEADVQDSLKLTQDERLRRIENLTTPPKRKLSVSVQFLRNPHVKAAALFRANGHCEHCEAPAPFISKSTKEPYLEVHHKIALKNGGLDNLDNVEALCPNCHRRKHFE